jgi:nitrous oxidase accessory protein NosD
VTVEGTCTGPFTHTKDQTLTSQGRAALDGNHAGSTVTVPDATRA